MHRWGVRGVRGVRDMREVEHVIKNKSMMVVVTYYHAILMIYFVSF